MVRTAPCTFMKHMPHAVRTNLRRPFCFPFGHWAEEIEFPVTLSDTIGQHRVHQQLARRVVAVALIVGQFGQEIATAMRNSEMGRHSAAIQIKHVEG